MPIKAARPHEGFSNQSIICLKCTRTKLTITISAIVSTRCSVKVINSLSTADSITHYVYMNILLLLSRLLSKRLNFFGGVAHSYALSNHQKNKRNGPKFPKSNFIGSSLRFQENIVLIILTNMQSRIKSQKRLWRNLRQSAKCLCYGALA